MKKYFFIAMCTFTALQNTYALDCDKQFIDSLKSNLDYKYDVVTGSHFRELICSKKNESNESKVGLYVPDYISIDLTGQKKSLAQACIEKDNDFFYINRSHILSSILPEGALQLIESVCNKNQVSFTAKSGKDNTVIFRVAANTGSGETIYINDFIYDGNSISCKENDLETFKQLPIGNEGRLLACERSGTKEDTVIIRVDKCFGDKHIVLPKTPNITEGEFVWEIIRHPKYSTSHFNCKNQFNQICGAWTGCDYESVPPPPACPLDDKKAVEFCKSFFGSKFKLVDGAYLGIPKNCNPSPW